MLVSMRKSLPLLEMIEFFLLVLLILLNAQLEQLPLSREKVEVARRALISSILAFMAKWRMTCSFLLLLTPLL